jgi:hypothetical protein
MGWTEKQFADLCEKAGVRPEDAMKAGKLDLTPKHKAAISESQTKKANKKHSTKKRIMKGYETRIKLGIPITEPKPNTPLALVAKTWRETKGDEGADRRIRVTIEGQRYQPIDPDNYTGGIKTLLDCIQLCGLIPEDSWEAIRLESKQSKVSSRHQEKTKITIEYPENLPGK